MDGAVGASWKICGAAGGYCGAGSSVAKRM